MIPFLVVEKNVSNFWQFGLFLPGKEVTASLVIGSMKGLLKCFDDDCKIFNLLPDEVKGWLPDVARFPFLVRRRPVY
jgi:hypothetical protein